MAFNLLYSLPEVLQSEIYQYDSTYRIFGNDAFKKDLADSFLSSPNAVKKCRDMVIKHLEDSIYDEGALWYNEYGRVDRDDELSKKLIQFRSTDDFRVVTMTNQDRSALFFKILPIKMTKKMVPFLGTQNTRNWDGFFIDVERNTATTQPELAQLITRLNQSCIGNATEMSNGWGVDPETENLVWLAPRIEMYLA